MLADGQIWAIGVSDDSFQTSRGFQVGDSVTKLESLYGPPHDISHASDIDSYNFVVNSIMLLSADTDKNSPIVTDWMVVQPIPVR